MKVLLLSRYGPLGASSRVRSYQYLPYLKAQGIDVTVSPLLGDDYLRKFYSGKVNHIRSRLGPYLRRFIQLLKSHLFDLLWIEKELFPWLPAWGEAILSHLGIPYVVDYDDAIFHRYDSHPNWFIRSLLENKIDIVMRHAVCVIAGNDYLAERARHAGAKRVEHVPTVVDSDRYKIKQKDRNTTFAIGWIGTPFTARYLDIVGPALTKLCENNSSHFVSVGAGWSGLDGAYITARPWSEASEVSEIQNFDVGIMPLPNNLWELGKCGYKLIQYMACGKPVVASPVGVNSKIVDHGVNGFLAGSTGEWLEALTVLRNNPDLRKRMGAAGRKKVEEKYCIQVTAPRLASIFQAWLENQRNNMLRLSF